MSHGWFLPPLTTHWRREGFNFLHPNLIMKSSPSVYVTFRHTHTHKSKYMLTVPTWELSRRWFECCLAARRQRRTVQVEQNWTNLDQELVTKRTEVCDSVMSLETFRSYLCDSSTFTPGVSRLRVLQSVHCTSESL